MQTRACCARRRAQLQLIHCVLVLDGPSMMTVGWFLTYPAACRIKGARQLPRILIPFTHESQVPKESLMRTQGPLTKTSGGVCCKRQGYLAGSQTHDLPFQGLGGACSLKDSPACRDFSWVGRISTRMVKYATNKIRRMSHLIFFQSGIDVALSQCMRIRGVVCRIRVSQACETFQCCWITFI